MASNGVSMENVVISCDLELLVMMPVISFSTSRILRMAVMKQVSSSMVCIRAKNWYCARL